jgi:ATP-binding cassette subfamily B protein
MGILRRKSGKDAEIRTTVNLAETTSAAPVQPAGAAPAQPAGAATVPPTGFTPTAVSRCLDAAGLNHRPVLLAVDTDVSLDGTPAREWLVVTPDHVSVVAEGHVSVVAEGRPVAESPGDLATDVPGTTAPPEPARLVRFVPWPEVEQVRTSAGVGGGTLQVRADGGWIDLVRFSNALATRFHKVSRVLEQAREAAPAAGDSPPAIAGPLVVDGPLDPPRCPSCALRLTLREESCPRCMQKGRILARVGSILAPHGRGALALCLLTLVGVVAELVPPKLQQYMVDDVLSGRDATRTLDGALAAPGDFRAALLVVVLALAFSRVLLSIVGVLKGRLATAIGTGLTGTLRSEMVEKLQNLAIAYYDRHQVGSMISRVAHDSEVLHGLMHQITGGFLLQIVQLVGVGGMLLWINPKLALFTLIPVPLVILGSWIFWRHVYPRHYRLWDASSKQMAALSGMLSGIRVVKAFAQEPRERDRFEKASDHLSNWRLWVEHTNSTYAAAMQIVFSLGGLIVWYVGGLDVIGGRMSLGQLIAFLAYLAMFYAPLGALSNFTTWLTSFLSGSQRVLELLDTPVTIPDAATPTPWPEARGALTFDNVTFGYDRNQPVLRDVSFAVAPGEMIGIVGRSGSGKTTLVNLLGRFYDVQEGSIAIDGIDIRDLSTKQLRERLGIVFQDSFLFRGTIWRNLSYGRPEATIEQGLEAAKAAGAHDFLCRQPLAYETLLGEHGAGLSGGEKQRLSIARTLLYDPRILVLDEATSNIDAEAEKAIQEALAVLVRGRTTIAIAHRLSTLRNADRILAFDRGRLVEQGTHAELLARDGIYARLVRIQTQVTKQPTVDTLLAERDKDAAPEPAAPALPEPALPAPAGATGIHWLDPVRHRFHHGDHDRIGLSADGQPLAAAAFIVRTFPASHPEAWLSVRGWNESGDEIELGMIRDLTAWPEEDRAVVRAAARRRSLVREIRRVHGVKLGHGYLDFDVDTDVGRRRFTTRWTQSQAIEFGAEGKMLIDTEENRYVVRRVDDLPRPDRERFLQYIYW